MRKPFLFVRAVARRWLVLATGVCSLAISVWEHAAEKPVKIDVFCVVGAALLVAAFYMAWAKEHDARVASERDPTLSRARRLTSDQAAKIRQSLAGLRGTISVANDLSSPDAFKFAEDFAAAFRAAEWTVERSPVAAMNTPAPSGVAVEYPHEGMWVPEPKLSASRIRDSLQAAMSSAGVVTDVRERTQHWSKVHACILIGHPTDRPGARSADTSTTEGTSP
jgi:hypothetical protein